MWQPFFDFVKQSPKQFQIVDELYAGAGPAQHWWDAPGRRAHGNFDMIPDTRKGSPATYAWWKGDQDQVGAYLHGYELLWLPASLLQPSQQSRLVDALFAASRYKEVELHFNKGLAGAPADAIAAAKDTATNPAMTDAFALAIVADGEAAAYPGLPRKPMDMAAAHKDARLIDLSAVELRKIAPDAGSYVSESNYFNTRWQQAFWGANYSRLRAVKDKYDPQGLFFVHHGVGSEDWSADGFRAGGSAMKITFAALLPMCLGVAAAHAAEPGWPTYGGDAGGQRYSAARQITPANVRDLQVAWTYSTGDLQTKGDAMKRASFENTPILAEGRLYVCSPFNEVSRARSRQRQAAVALRSQAEHQHPLSQRLHLPRRGVLACIERQRRLRRAHLSRTPPTAA